MNSLKKTNWWLPCKKIFGALVFTTLTSSASVFLVWILEQNKGPEATTINIIIAETIPWGILLGMFFFVVSEIFCFYRDYKTITEDAIRTALKDANVVIEMPISEFYQIYIKMIQNIMTKIKNSKEVYALDSSPPSQWWSNSMLGYLAIQIDWASKVLEKKVHRFFVMSDTDLLSLQGTKMMTFQILLGIHVYIMTPKTYDKLLKEYNKLSIEDLGRSIEINSQEMEKHREFEHENGRLVLKKKEFFTWENNNTIFTDIEKFAPNNVRGYQSTWFTDTPYSERGIGGFFDIKEEYREKPYEIYQTEFITRSTQQFATKYKWFAQFLIKKSEQCIKEKIAKKANIIRIPSTFENKPHDIANIKTLIKTFCESK